MKKLKLLVPALACTAATISPLVTLTSCKNKELVGYTVDKDTHRLYGLNKKNERFELKDEQIEDLKGGFLVTLGDESFLHVDKNGKGDDGKTYGKTIADFFGRAATTHAFYYEIWLLGGTYNLEPPLDDEEKIIDTHIKFDIKGIVDNDGNLTSTVDIVPGHPNRESEEVIGKNIDVGDFRDLNFSTVKIQGAMHERQGNGWHVEGADCMSFEYCHFYGLSIFNTEYLDLYGCTLDSDCIDWATPEEGSRTFSTTQYSLWVKNVDFASFSYCNFISDGKALKLQPMGINVEPRYVFNTCTFTIGEKGIPQEIPEGQTKTQSDQDKYAVDINNASITQDMWIYWYNIDGDIIKDEDPAKRDWKHHAGKVGEMESSQWIKDRAHIIEGELPG